MPNLSELTDYNPQDQVTPQGRLYVSPSIPTNDDGDYFTKPVTPMPELPADNVVERIIKKLAETDFSGGTDIGNKLAGTGGQERYQLWPEKIVRSALTAIPDAYSGKIPMNDVDPETGELVPSQAMIGRAMDMASFAGAGGVGGTGEGAGTSLGIVPVDVAKKLNFRTAEHPDILKQAIENTPAASVDADGHLIVKVTRNQHPDQEGAESVRGGVFYLPEGSKDAKYYSGKNENFMYGGKQNISGETAFKNPLVVKGATGGKAPEAAYNQIMGDKKAYENMRTEALQSSGGWLQGLNKGLKIERISSFLEKYAPEMAPLAEHILDSSSKGNQLPYALQEAAVASAARNAGHDGVIGYSVGRGASKGKPFLSEIYDVRENRYPSSDGDFSVHPELYADSSKPAAAIQAVDSSRRAFLRPALKYKDRLYKGKEGQEHQDVIPPHLYPEFQKMAMSGEDISHYNFGFVNDKGHFLSREDALKYGIDSGLIDPQAGKFGALTSTLMADSSKPGTAIEAMKTAQPKFDFSAGESSGSRTVKLGPTEITYGVNPKTNDVELSLLRTDKNARGLGNGRAATEQFLKEADDNGKRVLLNADPMDKSTSKTKLESFYKSLGFIRNSGRNKDFTTRAEYIRNPVLKSDNEAGAGLAAAKQAAPFYSALEHNVNAISQNKMNGEAWLGTLANKPGVKPEELDWTGLRSFLEENKGKPVTKEQVQEHLASNKVELKEVSKGAYLDPPEIAKLRDEFQKISDKADAVERNGGQLDQSEYDRMHELSGELSKHPNPYLKEGSDTKYHSYQLHGGENYREMLMTLPQKEGIAAKRIKEIDNRLNEITELPSSKHTSDTAKEFDALREERMNLQSQRNSEQGTAYKSSHWDEPNILAHVRMNDRTIEGKKSLHLEEIQSDWHQQGRDKGYRPEQEKQMANLVKQREDLQKEASVLAPSDARYKEIYAELPKLQSKINDIGSGGVGVPDAPFKKTWHELALKRMLREAAEKGYDRLSWTPGPEHNRRYPGRPDKEQKGMEYFYDTMLPKTIEKIGKEHGVKVQQLKATAPKYAVYQRVNKVSKEFDTAAEARSWGKESGLEGKATVREVEGTGNPHSVHYIDIPQGLKDKALSKGFPLFSSAYPTYSFTPVDGDPFKDKK